MFQFGLVGFPLDHSLSPTIHAAALRACGLTGSYSLFPVPLDEKQGLKEPIACLRSGKLHGLNVTIPHKQNVIPFLDELTPTAQAIGAVNTIYVRNGKLIGDNTDASGFLSDLNRFLRDHSSSLTSRKLAPGKVEAPAIVLGAGGSARAIVYALLNDGWKVAVAARRIEQAQRLASSFPNYQLQITDLDSFRFSLSSFNLLVNATPLGMFPNNDASPLLQNIAFPTELMIYDLVYNPRETKLVKDARAQGCLAITGLGMLIEQAALAFEIWTGCHPPREILRISAENCPRIMGD